MAILSKLKRLVKGDKLRIRNLHYKPDSWLKDLNIKPGFVPPKNKFTSKIDYRRLVTKSMGKKPLWDQYGKLKDYPREIEEGATRSSSDVSTQRNVGRLYTWLISRLKPEVIVEIGTAFGVSGMHWLAGLELNKLGKLYTFEPNTIWAEIANKNLAAISERYVLTQGTFEDNFKSVLGKQMINLAFIDAIHTSAFVDKQYDLIKSKLAPKGIVIFDDIDFSDDMRSCWENIVSGKDVLGSLEVNGIGILEVK